MYQIITLYTLNLHMLYDNYILIELGVKKKREFTCKGRWSQQRNDHLKGDKRTQGKKI